MNYTAGRYVVSFQAVRFYKGVRYHWMICFERKPDELVAWGHALTQELAESGGTGRSQELSSGLSHGGLVASTSTSNRRTHTRPNRRRVMVGR
jgi:hypothetical protein